MKKKKIHETRKKIKKMKSVKEKEEVKHEKKEKTKKGKKIDFWKISTFILLLLLIGLLIYYGMGQNTSNENAKEIPKTSEEKKAKVEFYVMSYCPYGNQAEEFLYEAYKIAKDEIEFEPHYVIYKNYARGSDQYCIENGLYCSMHGIQELHQDIREMCVYKYYGIEKWFDFAIAMNKECNSRNADTCWVNVAKDLGLDINKIKECQEKEGVELVKREFELNEKYNVRGSPTIFINGKEYRGARNAKSFLISACNQIEKEGVTGAFCSQLPQCVNDNDCEEKEGKIVECINNTCVYHEPVKVELIVINDKNCTTCDTTQIMSVNKRYFPGIVVKKIDISSQEGKELVKEYNIKFLPAYIFNASIVKTKTWRTTLISQYFDKVKDKYILKASAVGSTWPASPEVREEREKQQQKYENLTKNVSYNVNKEDNKVEVDLFVMSYCPYGNMAEEALKPVYDLLKDYVIIKPHYVIYNYYMGGSDQYCIENGFYCSMHGIQELHQDIREMCVYKYYGIEKWFDFAIAMNKECNSRNADTCWVNVAKDLGLDINKIKECQEKEGVELVAKEMKLNEILSVRGSPTIFIEGERYSGDRSPNDLKSRICEKFKDKPDLCEQELSSNNKASSGSCG